MPLFVPCSLVRTVQYTSTIGLSELFVAKAQLATVAELVFDDNGGCEQQH